MDARPRPADYVDGRALPIESGWSGRLGLASMADVPPGVDALILLPEDHEFESIGMSTLVADLEATGVEIVRFPIRDGGVPSDGDLRVVLDVAIRWLREGRTVVVACMAGMGRTGTVTACLCIDGGLGADAAIALIRSTRPGTIETRGQEDFVRRWAATSGR